MERVEAGLPVAIDRRVLSADDQIGDALFTGLRLRDGLNLDEWARDRGVDVMGKYGSELEPFIEAGLLELGAGRLWLTRRGMLVANEVMSTFV